MNYLSGVWRQHKEFWNAQRALSLVSALVLVGIALIVQRYADIYVSKVAGVPVSDIILDNIPTIDIDVLIVQGALIFTLVAAILVVVRPKYIIFTIKTLALFIIVRSFFISLTHLGISPNELQFDTSNIGYNLYNFLFNTRGDFFFSGHTGVPFLFAFIFWREKYWRYFFLAVSFVFGVSVLLAHIHYSIDVFAAPFMTYGIYMISCHLFPGDLKLFNPL